LITPEDRIKVVDLIREAVNAGARQWRCCDVLEISQRSYQRWERGDLQDKRKGAVKTVTRKLSEDERKQVIDISCSKEYKDLTPYEIVAILAQNGHYLASESTFYRILRDTDMIHHRSNSRPASSSNRPPELVATGPNQVWCWDITYLRSPISGIFYYAYVIEDIFSRKIVGWEIGTEESSEIAAGLFARICLGRGLSGIRLHSDNGNPMKGATMLALLYRLGIMPSFSRPRVSDDNPFIESLFRTVKYTTGYPKCFVDVTHARTWFSDFADWYNTKHLHSAIGYVTPSQRHDGSANGIYAERNSVYQKAMSVHPERFVNGIRVWGGPEKVYLNRAPASEHVELEMVS